jgi:DNA-binding NtrC family response regulator
MEMNNPGINSQALAALEDNHWPGNVRELANTLQKALIFSRGTPIQLEDIKQAISDARMAARTETESPEDVIRHWMRSAMTAGGADGKFEVILDRCASILISEALNLTDGNRSRAAKLLGLSRPTLHSKIEKYGLKLQTLVKEGA